jgi:hypothetical protein
VWISGMGRHCPAWWERVLPVVSNCSVFIVLLTPRSEAAAGVAQEIDYASRCGKPIITLKPPDLFSVRTGVTSISVQELLRTHVRPSTFSECRPQFRQCPVRCTDTAYDLRPSFSMESPSDGCTMIRSSRHIGPVRIPASNEDLTPSKIER